MSTKTFKILYTPTDALIPGPGWSGPTAQPSKVGNPEALGYEQNVICKWDVVPNQTFNTTYNIGVVAFHISGINYVTFAVERGMWKNIYTATPNSQTKNTSGVGLDYDATGKGVYDNGIIEYWATLDASLFEDDGQVEIRAIAYPNDGQPIVLPSLIMISNANNSKREIPIWVDSVSGNDSNPGTESLPLATIRAAIQLNGTNPINEQSIYLKAGNYTLQDTVFPSPILYQTGWYIVQPAPGVAREDVIVVGKGGTDAIIRANVSYKNITFMPTTNAELSALFNSANGGVGWLSGCNLVGPGLTNNANWSAIQLYVTDCAVSQCKEGVAGSIMRNISVDNTGQGGGDTQGGNLIVNYSVTNTKSDNLGTQNIVSGTASGTTCTLVVPNHGLQTNQWIAVSGCTPAEYNGGADENNDLRHITVIDANTFSYETNSAPGGPITIPGTVTLTTVFHGHFYQSYFPTGDQGNYILYGFYGASGGAQGGGTGYLTGVGTMTDVAVVKCNWDNVLTPNQAAVFGPKSTTTNFYILDCYMNGSANWDDTNGFSAVADVVVENSLFPVNTPTNSPNPYPHSNVTII